MKICVCERNFDSLNETRLSVVDIDKLRSIAKASNHDDKTLAEQWLNAIVIVIEEIKQNGVYRGDRQYKTPDCWCPEDAIIYKQDVPVVIDHWAEIFIK